MNIANKKILLVHNNPEERGRLGIMLSRFGHEVRFTSGNGCPENLRRDNDLIIVDDKLDGQSGFEFLKNFSNKLSGKVIYLSSISFFAGSIELQNLNIYEWIVKPVDPLKLAVVVCDFFIESVIENALPV